MAAETELTVQVDAVVFRSERTGWSVLRALPPDGGASARRLTVVGPLGHLHPGDVAALSGGWRDDAKWGRQFEARASRTLTPSGLAACEHFLGKLKGVGPATAKKLVALFGEQVLDVIWDDPARLAEVPGLSPKRATAVRGALAERRADAVEAVSLAEVGVPDFAVRAVLRLLGRRAVEEVRANPYALIGRVRGIGFARADAIARKVGFPLQGVERIHAGLRYALEHATDEGSTYLPRTVVLNAACRLLTLTRETIEPHLVGLEAAGGVVVDGEAVYLPLYHGCECAVAEGLLALARAPLGEDVPAPAGYDPGGLELTVRQAEAVETSLRGKAMILTGGPGSGKTTVTRVILDAHAAAGARLVLLAPTGRAAKRLSEVTGRPASTIHRGLEYHPELGWRRNREHPLDVDLVLVDETSMVDVVLMSRLLDAVPPGARLVLVGDADQLPSVGAGRVLRDAIESCALPVVELDHIHRQAAGSRIVVNAHRLNAGMPLDLPAVGEESDLYLIPRDDKETIPPLVVELVVDKLPRRFGFDPLADIWVVAPQKVGPLGTEVLNRLLQERLNPGGEPLPWATRRGFRVADRVMQVRNDYDLGVFNGDVGTLRGFDLAEELVRVDFGDRTVDYAPGDLKSLQLAYASTVHKSQGSEFPCVVLILHATNWIMLTRPLVYTGMTRASRLLVIVGQPKALHIASQRPESDRRHSGLGFRLAERAGPVLAAAAPVDADAALDAMFTDLPPGDLDI